MEFRHYEHADDFMESCGGFLLEREAEHCLLLGLACRLMIRPPKMSDTLYMASVRDEEKVVAAALMTSPFHLLLTAAPDEALHRILHDAQSRGLAPSGLLAPKREAGIFMELWCAATGTRGTLTRAERIYQLREVIPAAGVPGTIRTATDDDFEMVMEWGAGFNSDVGFDVTREHMETVFRSSIGEQRLFIWEDGTTPVSTATWLGPTPNGVRIGGVYTPPEHRGRGYASACVAALSQHLLDAGRSFCCLFTDLSNPTSNSIYQKIGYRPVVDMDAYDLGGSPGR